MANVSFNVHKQPTLFIPTSNMTRAGATFIFKEGFIKKYTMYEHASDIAMCVEERPDVCVFIEVKTFCKFYLVVADVNNMKEILEVIR
jgi:hypothetical protein